MQMSIIIFLHYLFCVTVVELQLVMPLHFYFVPTIEVLYYYSVANAIYLVFVFQSYCKVYFKSCYIKYFVAYTQMRKHINYMHIFLFLNRCLLIKAV